MAQRQSVWWLLVAIWMWTHMGKHEYCKIGEGCNVMCVMFLLHAGEGEMLPKESEHTYVNLVAVSNQLKCFLWYMEKNLRLWHYEKKEFVKSISLPDRECLYFIWATCILPNNSYWSVSNNQMSEAVLCYYCPDFPSCLAYLVTIWWASWAI